MKTAPRKGPAAVIAPAAGLLFCVMMVIYPKETLEASGEGLSLWFNQVLPTLLPFAVGINLLTELGVVHFLGVLFGPVMYGLFKVPGCGGFALVSGLMSGYPLGARVTAELRSDGSLTAVEAQRLTAFSNNSGPLFIIGAVGAGMLGSAAAGYFIYALHVLGAFCVGLLFRRYGRREDPSDTGNKKRLFPKAYRAMIQARAARGQSLGPILGSAVTDAMEAMLLVGGFIVLFSVLTRIAGLLGLFDLAGGYALRLFSGAGLDAGDINGIITGFAEITNGVKALSLKGETKIVIIAAAGVVSWGGLSIHAQTAGILAGTGIKTGLYLLAKALHAGFAVALGLLLYPLYEYICGQTVAVSLMDSAFTETSAGFLERPLRVLAESSGFLCASVAAIVVLAVVTTVIRKAGHTSRRR